MGDAKYVSRLIVGDKFDLDDVKKSKSGGVEGVQAMLELYLRNTYGLVREEESRIEGLSLGQQWPYLPSSYASRETDTKGTMRYNLLGGFGGTTFFIGKVPATVEERDHDGTPYNVLVPVEEFDKEGMKELEKLVGEVKEDIPAARLLVAKFWH